MNKKNKKSDTFLGIGLILNSIYLFLNHIESFPEFFKGFFAGLGLFFMLVGIFGNVAKMKLWKKDLYHKIIRRN